jgi:hypothetical protein
MNRRVQETAQNAANSIFAENLFFSRHDFFFGKSTKIAPIEHTKIMTKTTMEFGQKRTYSFVGVLLNLKTSTEIDKVMIKIKGFYCDTEISVKP